MKHWKEFKCPTCGAEPGHSCGKIKLGTLSTWVTTAPHAARKRLVKDAEIRRFKCSRCGEIVEARYDLGGNRHDVIPSAVCNGLTSLYEVDANGNALNTMV